MWKAVVAIAILGLAPVGLWLFLWSRVTTVVCTFHDGPNLVCDVSADAIALSTTKHVELRDVVAIHVAGDYERTRGDAWIEAVTQKHGVVSLTPGFNGSKGAQMVLAEQLEAARARGVDTTVSATIGSRTGVLFVPVMCVVGALFLGWIAYRVRLVRIRREGWVAEVRIGLVDWRPTMLDLASITAFRAVADVDGKRSTLQAVGTDGRGSNLVRVEATRVERVKRELEAFLL